MRKRMKAMIIVMMILPFPFVLLLFTSGERQETGERPEYIIGFVETATEDSGKAQINQIVRQVCDQYPYQMLEIQVERDRASQIEAMRALIAYKVDVIVISPVVAREWENVLKEADAAGIPILTIDKGITEAVEGIEISYVGFAYDAAAAKLAACYLDQASRDSIMLELCGTVGAYSSLQITKGFRELLRAETEEKDDLITYSLSEDFLQSRARQATKRIVNTMGELDVVMSHGDAMTIGAVAAIEEVGLVPGEDVLIYAISCSEEVKRLVEAGKVNCIAYCDVSLMSDALSDTLIGILEEDKDYVNTMLPVQIIQRSEGL